jgi:hypothetical protein
MERANVEQTLAMLAQYQEGIHLLYHSRMSEAEAFDGIDRIGVKFENQVFPQYDFSLRAPHVVRIEGRSQLVNGGMFSQLLVRLKHIEVCFSIA